MPKFLVFDWSGTSKASVAYPNYGCLKVIFKYFISEYLFKLEASLFAWICAQFSPKTLTEKLT